MASVCSMAKQVSFGGESRDSQQKDKRRCLGR
jgi:hypothetical protein